MSDYFGRVRSAIRTGLGRLSGAANVGIRKFPGLIAMPPTLQRIGDSVRKTGQNLILAAFGAGLFLSDASWYLGDSDAT